MHHRNGQPSQVAFQGFWCAPRRYVGPVIIAAYHPYRCVSGQLVEHVGRTHVAGMKDQVGTA